jgi:hypothetical protein
MLDVCIAGQVEQAAALRVRVADQVARSQDWRNRHAGGFHLGKIF